MVKKGKRKIAVNRFWEYGNREAKQFTKETKKRRLRMPALFHRGV